MEDVKPLNLLNRHLHEVLSCTSVIILKKSLLQSKYLVTLEQITPHNYSIELN